MKLKLFILFFFIPAMLYAQDWDFLGDWSEAVEREEEVRETIDARLASIRALAEDKFVDEMPSIWPVEGRISSGFGWRIHPICGKIMFHAGVDIANRIGTPVVATGGGQVMFTGWNDNLGWYVKIRHTSRLVTKYGHLSTISVDVGDQVERGRKVGEVGISGRVTGPHVHYSVVIDGVNVNPVEWMDR